MTFFERLQPIVKDAGFRMEGYHVWCGSPIIGEDGACYLFASRWKKETGFPQGYMHHSEIVLARTESLDQPFTYVKTIIGKREQPYWDATMAHNPQIHRIGGQYVLLYIGSPDGTAEKRAIGYATSPALEGPWVRSQAPIDLPDNANNPAVCMTPDGDVLLIFRDGRLKVSTAQAKHFAGPYTILNDDVFPGIRLEDFYLSQTDNGFELLAEDNAGGFTGHERFGAHFVSKDGVHWLPNDPVIAYDHTLPFTDGSSILAERRERPQLLMDDGKAIALFTAILKDGNTWNCVQKIKG